MFERRWGLVPCVLGVALVVGCGGDPPARDVGRPLASGAVAVVDVDASSLVSGPSEEVELRAGVAIVPACAVVPVEDVRAAGLPLLASPLTAAARRVRLDPAVLDATRDGLGGAPPGAAGPLSGLPAEVNSCWYALSGDRRRGSVRATVLQPALFGHDTALDGPPAALPGAAAAGVDVRVVHAATTDDPRATHVLRHSGTVVELVVEHLDAESGRALVESAAARLAASAARPTGQPAMRHATAAVPGSHADACALTSGSVVADAFGGARPLVSERFASTAGVLDTGPTRGAYVDHRCVRSSPDGSARDVNVHAATFSHADGARAAFDRLVGRPGVEPVAGIGEAAARGDLPDLDDALAFRVGRVVVHVSDGGTESAAVLARAIAARLGGDA